MDDNTMARLEQYDIDYQYKYMKYYDKKMKYYNKKIYQTIESLYKNGKQKI